MQFIQRSFFFALFSSLLLLSACSAREPKETPLQATAFGLNPPASAFSDERSSDLYRHAQLFNQWVLGQLDADQFTELERNCRSNPDENPFCYSIMNRDLLESQAGRLSKTSSRQRAHPMRPRFQRRQVTNWLELRFAPIPALLRGVAAARPSELEQLRKLALKETRCPNNIAVALAATLEDQIGEGIDLLEIATLYAKGADCLAYPNDRENLLTRAGLFYYAKGNLRRALQLFRKASTIETAFVARSLYWLYRTHLELKQKDKAEESLEQLQSRYPFSFHTLVALTSLGKDPGEVLSRSSARVTRSAHISGINHLIEQTEILYRFGFQQSAAKTLDWAIQAAHSGAEPELMLYLAELKRDQGDYHAKITILSDVLYKHPSLVSRSSLELYFPKVYFPIFERQFSLVDPYLLIAVARRESAFRPQAVSSAKARGLLQVLPETGRRIAGPVDLLDPDKNVEVGARYLTDLLQKTGGQIHMALAAYNAGPHKLATWTDRYPVTDAVLFTDLIPYRETREYVASVLRNYYWYRRIHKNDLPMTPKQITHIANMGASANAN